MGKLKVCEMCHKFSCTGKLYKMIGQEFNTIVCEKDTKKLYGKRVTRCVRGHGEIWWVEVVPLD